MSHIGNAVRVGTYFDSVLLMRVAQEVRKLPGVQESALMMATPANQQLMLAAGVLDSSLAPAGPDDLLIAVRANDAKSAQAALRHASAALDTLAVSTGRSGSPTTETANTLDRALALVEGANLALVSVPGEFAAAEAADALDAGLDVMVFSDNVPLSEERELKERAGKLGRLVLGPDCGTAIIGGCALGFANAIASGSIGVVSASGTGLQELSVLLAAHGLGLSHGLGVGGRDLSAEVGGLSTSAAIALLADDSATERIVLVSKPPGDEVRSRVLGELRSCGKPAVACFLGQAWRETRAQPHEVPVFGTLIETAEALVGTRVDALGERRSGNRQSRVGTIRGLFSGGSLCAEAQTVLVRAGMTVESNAPISGASTAAAIPAAKGHCLMDLGADEFTRGRPHPMLEPSVRDQPLREALRDPSVAVVLLDVVLGFGAHSDPAGAVVEVVREFQSGAECSGPRLVASVCGTDADPQGLAGQRAKLESVGVEVFAATARACEYALSQIGSDPHQSPQPA